MREIKFRGQMTTGEWVFGLPHLDIKNSTAYWNECSYRICWNLETGGQANAPIKNGSLSQYTGLKDKNGKEIYEGDVVEVWIVTNPNEWSHQEKMEVVFKCGMFCIANSRRSITLFNKCNPKPLNRYFECEVIGNIFQHPELIKQ